MVAPQGFQLVVVNIQAAVAVLDQDVRGSGVAREIADAHSVDIDMVKRVLPIGNATVECFQRLSGFRNWDACQFSAGCAFQNAQTKIHNGHNFIFTVAVDIRDLERKIRCQVAMGGIAAGLADLPENLSVHIKRGHAADIGVTVGQNPLMVLAQDHIQFAVSGQIAEAQMTSGAEIAQ